MKISYIIVLFLVLLQIAFAEDYRTIQRNTSIITRDGVSHKTIENFGEYHALLIYVEDYNNTNIYPILTTPKNDVHELAKILHKRYNFSSKNIHIVPNPKNADELIREFDNLSKLLTEHDNLLIYYAGHAGIKKDTQKGYWNLADAVDLNKVGRQGSISLEEAVLNSLQSIKSKHVLVISDSCYSGILTRGKSAEETLGSISENEKKYYQEIYERYSRTALTSGGLTPVRDQDIIDKNHSIFAANFLRVLRKNRQPIFALNEKYKDICKYVSNNTNNKQIPEYEGIKNSGQEPNGDFIFIDNKSVLDNKDIEPLYPEDDFSPVNGKELPSSNVSILVWSLGVVSLLLLIVSIKYFRTRKKIPIVNKDKEESVVPPIVKKTKPIKKKMPTKIEGVLNMGKLTYQNQPFTKEYTWQEAKEYAKKLRLGGFDDWRLPTLKELRALGNVELYEGEDNDPFWKEWSENHKDYALPNLKNEKHFIKEKLVKNMPRNSVFWTSESKDEDDVYLVAFHLGCNYVDGDTSMNYVLCVRDNNEGED